MQGQISRKRKLFQHTNDNEGQDGVVPDVKRRRVIGQPRFPPQYLRQYDTSHYTLYDHVIGNVGPHVSGPFRNFPQYDEYDEYTLFMSPALKRVEEIPISGVRLDDMTAAFVLPLFPQHMLRTNWPAEFDAQGMIRGTRVSLGHAAKFWKEEGDTDVDGNIVPKGKAGYYYKWWRGLHCLCGKEGLDHNVYQIRPSYETPKCLNFGFKVSSRAKIQLPSGDPADQHLRLPRLPRRPPAARPLRLPRRTTPQEEKKSMSGPTSTLPRLPWRPRAVRPLSSSRPTGTREVK